LKKSGIFLGFATEAIRLMSVSCFSLHPKKVPEFICLVTLLFIAINRLLYTTNTYGWDSIKINEELKMSDKENYEIIDRGMSGERKMPSAELLLRMRAAFEANDVETIETLEKDWFQEY
jgi:hypothetical protein